MTTPPAPSPAPWPAAPPGSPPQAEAGGWIRVNAGFFFLAFILYFFKPTVVIDGVENVTRWGTADYPVAAGPHTVKVFFKYLFLKEAGRSEVTVDVPAGQVVALRYRAPWFVFNQGKITREA